MKRIIAAIIAISYLCLSTGFTLHEHYCMGKLVSTRLTTGNHSDSHKCLKCGMEKKSSKKGCCKDSYKVVKGKADAAFAKVVIHYTGGQDAVAAALVYFASANPNVANAQQKREVGRPHGPPLDTDLRLNVRNCVFLI